MIPLPHASCLACVACSFLSDDLISLTHRGNRNHFDFVFLTTVPPPSANFLASLSSFLPHFGIRGKYISSVQRRHLYWSSASQRPLRPQSILHYLFSSLSYVSRLFHCLLFHVSGPHPGITCLSPQGIWQGLETSLIVTMGGATVLAPSGGATGYQHPRATDAAKHPPEHTPSLQHACTCPWPPRFPGLQILQPILPPSLPFSFSLSLSLTHTEKHANKLHFKHIFPLTLQLFVAILIFIFLFS